MDAKNELGSTSHGSFSASGAVGVRARSWMTTFQGLVGSSVIMLGLPVVGRI
jgi:hypothetical protein